MEQQPPHPRGDIHLPIDVFQCVLANGDVRVACQIATASREHQDFIAGFYKREDSIEALVSAPIVISEDDGRNLRKLDRALEDVCSTPLSSPGVQLAAALYYLNRGARSASQALCMLASGRHLTPAMVTALARRGGRPPNLTRFVADLCQMPDRDAAAACYVPIACDLQDDCMDAIHSAIRYGHVELVRAILAKINYYSSVDTDKALLMACEYQQPEIAAILFDGEDKPGPNILSTGFETPGKKPIMYAIEASDVALAEVLITHGAVIDRVDFRQACNVGSLPMVRLLVERSGANDMINDELVMATCCYLGKGMDILDYLVLDCGAEFDDDFIEHLWEVSRDRGPGPSPGPTIMRLLAADVLWPGTDLLDLGGIYDDVNLLRALVEKHGLRPADSETALVTAAYFGSEDACRFLLENGADVNRMAEVSYEDGEDLDGLCTALHWAVAHKDVDICRLLVTYGADVNAKSGDGGTPLDVIAGLDCRDDDEDIAEMRQLLCSAKP